MHGFVLTWSLKVTLDTSLLGVVVLLNAKGKTAGEQDLSPPGAQELRQGGTKVPARATRVGGGGFGLC